MNILAGIQSWFLKASLGVKIGTIAASVIMVSAAITVPIIIINSGSSSEQATETDNKTANTSKKPQSNSNSSAKDQDSNSAGDTNNENLAQNGNNTSNAGSNSPSSNNSQQSQSNNTSTNTSKPSNNSSNTSKPSTSTTPSTSATNPSTSTKYDCKYLNDYAANHNGRVPEGYDRDEYMRNCWSEADYNDAKFWETHQAFYGDGMYTDIEQAAMVLWTNQHCTYSNGQQSCNAHQPWLLPTDLTNFYSIAATYCKVDHINQTGAPDYDCYGAPDWVTSLKNQLINYQASHPSVGDYMSIYLRPAGTNNYTIYDKTPTVPTSIYPTNCTRQTVSGQNNVLVCPFKGSY